MLYQSDNQSFAVYLLVSINRLILSLTLHRSDPVVLHPAVFSTRRKYKVPYCWTSLSLCSPQVERLRPDWSPAAPRPCSAAPASLRYNTVQHCNCILHIMKYEFNEGIKESLCQIYQLCSLITLSTIILVPCYPKSAIIYKFVRVGDSHLFTFRWQISDLGI